MLPDRKYLFCHLEPRAIFIINTYSWLIKSILKHKNSNWKLKIEILGASFFLPLSDHILTFEWDDSFLHELFILEESPEATSAHRAKGHIRYPKVGRDLKRVAGESI